MKIWANLILGAMLLCACGETEHAGVLSETESGKTVAGIVSTSAGTPLSKTAVYVVPEDFNAAKDSVLSSTTSDGDGFFSLDVERLSPGNYAFLFENEEALLAGRRIVPLDLTSDTIRLDQTVSSPSDIAVSLSGYGLSEGDFICLEGSFSCTGISGEEVQDGIAFFEDVPASVYGKMLVFEKSEIPVNWKIDSGSFYVAHSADADSVSSPSAHVRYAAESSYESFPDTVSPFEVFSDGKVAVSLWAKLDENAFGADSNVAIFTAMQDSTGFVIRQNATNGKKAIGVELFVDADSVVISDTSIYGSIKILDGEWHQIALLVNGKHITVMLNGEVLRDTDFQLGNGFGNPMQFVIGDSRLNGTIENVTVYDGGQDSLFMRTMYDLEKIRFQ